MVYAPTVFHPQPGAAAPSPYPPVGYRMCQVCGSDFAVRACTGEGCAQGGGGGGEGGGGEGGGGEGGGGAVRSFNYCYRCFVQYHPRSDAQWRGHWVDAREAAAAAAAAGGGSGGGGSTPLAVVPAPEDPAALREEHVAAMRAAMPLGGGGAGAGAGAGAQPAAGSAGGGGASAGFSLPVLSVS